MVTNVLQNHIELGANNMPDYIEDKVELQTLVKDFFENYLDVWEESDSGREFHPITISCCRCMKIEPLNILLERMRELSEAKPAHKIRERDD